MNINKLNDNEPKDINQNSGTNSSPPPATLTTTAPPPKTELIKSSYQPKIEPADNK